MWLLFEPTFRREIYLPSSGGKNQRVDTLAVTSNASTLRCENGNVRMGCKNEGGGRGRGRQAGQEQVPDAEQTVAATEYQ
jgi:hypothetical protein